MPCLFQKVLNVLLGFLLRELTSFQSSLFQFLVIIHPNAQFKNIGIILDASVPNSSILLSYPVSSLLSIILSHHFTITTHPGFQG